MAQAAPVLTRHWVEQFGAKGVSLEQSRLRGRQHQALTAPLTASGKGSARSESEIMIQWQPPSEDAQNGEILGYIVRYRLFGYNDSPWSYRNVTKQLKRTYLITELITWKDYEIQIAAYNFKGTSPTF